LHRTGEKDGLLFNGKSSILRLSSGTASPGLCRPQKNRVSIKEIGKMAKHDILLVCGSGASSGFMAANIRKAASARGLEWKVTARSESEILNYVEDIDCLMVGPHLASNLGAIEEDCEGYDIKVALLTKEAYSKLNGDLAVDQILEMFGEK
jgi:PTS system cellobiose-specific IIB component